MRRDHVHLDGADLIAYGAWGRPVLLFPAELADQLAGFDPGDMQLLPVRSLDEAIEALTPGAAG